MRLNAHHHRAAALLGCTAVLVAVFGALIGHAERVGPWHGMFCATGLATTDGCDLQFRGWQAYTLAELSMILMIPLWGAVFSFLAAGLTADHLDKRHAQMADHVTATAMKGAAGDTEV